MRNCDGFTNPEMRIDGIGFIKRCPNALEPRSALALRWWADFHRWEGRVLPYPGLELYAQPVCVVQAIRAGEAEFQKAQGDVK